MDVPSSLASIKRLPRLELIRSSRVAIALCSLGVHFGRTTKPGTPEPSKSCRRNQRAEVLDQEDVVQEMKNSTLIDLYF